MGVPNFLISRSGITSAGIAVGRFKAGNNDRAQSGSFFFAAVEQESDSVAFSSSLVDQGMIIRREVF